MNRPETCSGSPAASASRPPARGRGRANTGERGSRGPVPLPAALSHSAIQPRPELGGLARRRLAAPLLLVLAGQPVRSAACRRAW